MYFPINNLETYNVVFTTSEQWAMYEFKLKLFGKKGFITVEEYTILNKIIGEETKLNDLFHIMKKITGILLDFHSSRIPNKLLSIGDTDNKKKINFTNIKESEDIVDGHKYFIYEIK